MYEIYGLTDFLTAACRKLYEFEAERRHPFLKIQYKQNSQRNILFWVVLVPSLFLFYSMSSLYELANRMVQSLVTKYKQIVTLLDSTKKNASFFFNFPYFINASKLLRFNFRKLVVLVYVYSASHRFVETNCKRVKYF